MHNTWVVTGGTGLIGAALCKALMQQGKKVIVLTRKVPQHTVAGVSYLVWNIEEKRLEGVVLESDVCVVHLAGANVAKGRWTNARKQEITESRVASTLFLHDLIREKKINASHLICASAIGIYAHDNMEHDENSNLASDFLAQTCIAWEQAAAQNSVVGTTVFRIGIVLSQRGGAYAALTAPLKWGVRPLPAGGEQYYSWIHIQDVVDAILYAAHQQLNGTYNLVAGVDTCKTIINKAAKQKNVWSIGFAVPSFLLKIVLGDMSAEVLRSNKVKNQRLLSTGFELKYQKIEDAIVALELEG